MTTLSQQLWDARLRAGLSREAVKRQTGVSISHLEKIERGYCHPRPHTLEALTAVYRVRVVVSVVPEESEVEA